MHAYISAPDKYEFTAVVASCTLTDGAYDVVLSESWFFPEAGGQPADRGTINGIEVLQVADANPIVHRVAQEINVGSQVVCKIDQRFRWENSQQHSGQHVLSAIIEQKHSAQSSSFKIHPEGPSTIEVSVKLNRTQLDEIEQAVFDVISDRKPVQSVVINDKGLIPVGLRKSYDFVPLRLVTIQDIDECPCCGTHVDNTSSLGAFRIFSTESTSSGTKLYFAFGGRCSRLTQSKLQILTQMCSNYTCSDVDLPRIIENNRQEMKAQTKKSSELLKLMMPHWLEKNITQCGGVQCVFYPFSSDAQVVLAALSKTSENGVVVSIEGNSTQIVVNAKNAQEIYDKITNAFKDRLGKCGGNGTRRSIVVMAKLKQKQVEELLKE